MSDINSNQNPGSSLPLNAGTVIPNDQSENFAQLDTALAEKLRQAQANREQGIKDLLDNIHKFQLALASYKKDLLRYASEEEFNKWNLTLDKYFIELEKDLRNGTITSGNPSSVIFNQIREEIVKDVVQHIPTEYRNDVAYIEDVLKNFPLLQNLNDLQRNLNNGNEKATRRYEEQEIEKLAKEAENDSKSKTENSQTTGDNDKKDKNLNYSVKQSLEIDSNIDNNKYVENIGKYANTLNSRYYSVLMQLQKIGYYEKELSKLPENHPSRENIEASLNSAKKEYFKVLKIGNNDPRQTEFNLESEKNNFTVGFQQFLNNQNSAFFEINNFKILQNKLQRLSYLERQIKDLQQDDPSKPELEKLFNSEQKEYAEFKQKIDGKKVAKDIASEEKYLSEKLQKLTDDGDLKLPRNITQTQLKTDGDIDDLVKQISELQANVFQYYKFVNSAQNQRSDQTGKQIDTIKKKLVQDLNKAQNYIDETEKSRSELVKEVKYLLDYTKKSKQQVDKLFNRQSSSNFLLELIDADFDIDELSPQQLLTITNQIEGEIDKFKATGILSSNSIHKKAIELFANYEKSKALFSEVKKNNEACGIINDINFIPKIPWKNYGDKKQMNDGSFVEFTDPNFDTTNISKKISQLVSASDLDTYSSSVLPIRDDDAAEMIRLGIIDKDGYYNYDQINYLKLLAAKDPRFLSLKESETVAKLNQLELHLTAREYAQNISANSLSKLVTTFTDNLAPGDREILEDKENVVNDSGTNMKLSEYIVSKMLDDVAWSSGIIQANASKEIGAQKDGIDIASIIQLTAERVQKYVLNDSKIEEIAEKAIDNIYKNNLIKNGRTYTKSDLENIKNSLVENAKLTIKSLALRDAVTLSKFDAHFVGESDSAGKASAAGVIKIQEKILVEGKSEVLANLEKIANQGNVDINLDQTTPPSETAETINKSSKNNTTEYTSKVKEAYFAPAPSVNQYFATGPVIQLNDGTTTEFLGKIFSLAGRTFDSSESAEKYAKEVRENLIKEKYANSLVESSAFGTAIEQQSELGDYLLATLKGGDEWLKYKQTKEARKKQIRELKFWDSISKIPLVGGLAEVRQYIDEMTSQLPEAWQSDIKKTGAGNDFIKDGKINPILPSLLSAKNSKGEVLFSKLMTSAGVLAEGSSNDYFTRVLRNFVGGKEMIFDKSGKYVATQDHKYIDAGITKIPFLTKSVLFKPKIYMVEKRDKFGNILRDENGNSILQPSTSIFQRKKNVAISSYQTSVSPQSKVKARGVGQEINDKILSSLGLIQYKYDERNKIYYRINRPLAFIDNIGNKTIDKSLEAISTTNIGKKIGLNKYSIDKWGVQSVRWIDNVKFDTYQHKRRSILDITLRIVVKTIEEGVKGIFRAADKIGDSVKLYRDIKESFGIGKINGYSNIDATRIAFQQASAGLKFLGTIGEATIKSLPAAAIAAIPGAYLGGKLFGSTGVAVGAFGGALLGGVTKGVDYLSTPLKEFAGRTRFQNAVDTYWGAGHYYDNFSNIETYQSAGEFMRFGRNSMLSALPMDTKLPNGIDLPRDFEQLIRKRGLMLNSEGKLVALKADIFKDFFAKGGLKNMLIAGGFGAVAGAAVAGVVNGVKSLLGIQTDLTGLYLPAAVVGGVAGFATPLVVKWIVPNVAGFLGKEGGFGRMMRVMNAVSNKPTLFESLLRDGTSKKLLKFFAEENRFSKIKDIGIAARSGLYTIAGVTFVADLLGLQNPLLIGALVGAGTALTDFALRRWVQPLIQNSIITPLLESSVGKFFTRINPIFHLPVLDALGVGISIAQFNEVFVTPFRGFQMLGHLDVYLRGGEYTITTQIPSMNFDGTYTYNHTVKFEGILNNPYYLNAFLNTVPLGIGLQGLSLIAGTRETFFRLAKNFGSDSVFGKVVRGIQGGDTVWGRIVRANLGESNWVTGLNKWVRAQNIFFSGSVEGNIFQRAWFGLRKNIWNFLKNANPLNWEISAFTAGGLAGGLIGGILGGLVTTALFGTGPLVAIGAFVGSWIGASIGTAIAAGLGLATGGLGFLATTAIVSTTTFFGNIIGGGVGKLAEMAWNATFGATEKALQLAQEAFSRLMGVFSLVKAYLDGDLAKMIMTVFQMSMAGMVAGPILIGLPLTASWFTPSAIPPNELIILPISTYVTKSFNTGSYDPTVPSVKFSITIDTKNLPKNGKGIALNLTDAPDNVADIYLQMLTLNGVSANGNNITIIGNYENTVTFEYEVKLKSKIGSGGICNHLTGSAIVYDASNAEMSRSQVASSVCVDSGGNLIKDGSSGIYTPVQIGNTPINGGSVSQCFGANDTEFAKHQGMDIAIPSGTAVYAVDNATILRTGFDTRGGYFIQYKLDSQSVYIIYYHLQTIAVSAGQNVNSGDAIGLSDSTGKWTTGPHLHIEVRTTDSFNDVSTLVNPCYLQDSTGKSICLNYTNGARCIPSMY